MYLRYTIGASVKKWSFYGLYFGHVINRILYSCTGLLLTLLNKIIFCAPEACIIWFYSTCSINSVLNLQLFNILYLNNIALPLDLLSNILHVHIYKIISLVLLLRIIVRGEGHVVSYDTISNWLLGYFRINLVSRVILSGSEC
jgi:hypothetical protein